MKSLRKTLFYFLFGIILMGGIYYYLDQIYLAPATGFTVSDEAEKSPEKDQFDFVSDKAGKTYYSHNKKYMAVVKSDSIKIYLAGKPNATEDVTLGGKSVSFFEWMPDRDLAIIALYGGDTPYDIVLEQYNPESPEHKVDTKLEDLPRNSRITDMAYSTATNAIYMKVRVAEDTYRVYRTDANYATRRINVRATNIGRVGVFYDEDRFFYDNLSTGDVFMYDDNDETWRAINPKGRYLLVGVDKDRNIYIANVNSDNEVLSVSKGQLGVGFEKIVTYDTPKKMSEVTIASAIKDGKDQDSTSSSSSSKK